MNINMYIVKDYISAPVIYSHLTSSRNDLNIKSFSFYKEGITIDPEILYIIDRHSISDSAYAVVMKNTSASFIVADNHFIPGSAGAEVIVLSSDTDTMSLPGLLFGVFREFHDLEEKLYRCIAENASLDALGEAVLPYLYNPISVYTASHRILFGIERQKDPNLRYFNYEEENAYLPENDLDEIRFREDFLATLYTTEPDIYPADMWGYRILYFNLHIEGLYVARAMSYEIDRPIRDSDWAILKLWGKFVCHILSNSDIMGKLSHPKGFDDLIHAYIEEESASSMPAEKILHANGWSLSDMYICAVFDLDTNDNRTGKISSVCANLEMRFSKSSAMVYKDSVLLIINVSLIQADYNEIRQLLAVFLRESILKAGISTMFPSLDAIASYYKQAKRALYLGKKINPMYWSYPYEKYIFTDMLSSSAYGYTLYSLCPPGLLDLIQYDIEHGHDFSHTLKTYLDNSCNLAACTRILYLQRSTLNYQLKRIQEISRMDLKNSRHRHLLLHYFYLLDLNHIDLQTISTLEDLKKRSL